MWFVLSKPDLLFYINPFVRSPFHPKSRCGSTGNCNLIPDRYSESLDKRFRTKSDIYPDLPPNYVVQILAHLTVYL